MLTLLFPLPIVALVALLILGYAFRRHIVTRWIVGGVVTGAGVAAALTLYGIFHSTSSTAAIGLLFVPLAMLLGGAVGGPLGFATYQATHVRQRMLQGVRQGAIAIASVALLMFVVGYTVWQARRIQTFHLYQNAENVETLVDGEEHYLRAKDSFLLSAIAANNRLPADALLRIARDPDPGLHRKRSGWVNMFDRDQLAVMRKVVRNPNVPVEALVILSASPDDYVLADVCGNSRTPEAVLRGRCAQNDSYLVHWSLAANPRAPADLLAALPRAKDKYVAHGLAYNPSTPATILGELAVHEDPLVRQGVAQNSSTGAATLAVLAQDRVDYVSRAAQQRIRTPH